MNAFLKLSIGIVPLFDMLTYSVTVAYNKSSNPRKTNDAECHVILAINTFSVELNI